MGRKAWQTPQKWAQTYEGPAEIRAFMAGDESKGQTTKRREKGTDEMDLVKHDYVAIAIWAVSAGGCKRRV